MSGVSFGPPPIIPESDETKFTETKFTSVEEDFTIPVKENIEKKENSAKGVG